MNRRNLILMASAGVGVLALPAAYFKYVADDHSDLVMPLHLTYLWDVKTLRNIGKLYRQQFPKENDQSRLLELLLQEDPKNLELTITDDYAHKRIVLLDGWMLSVTEGRQCALFSFAKIRTR